MPKKKSVFTITEDLNNLFIERSAHYVDPITHQLRIEVDPGEFHRVAFEDVVGLTAVE
nr:hypothetical protein [Priestia megaterium]